LDNHRLGKNLIWQTISSCRPFGHSALYEQIAQIIGSEVGMGPGAVAVDAVAKALEVDDTLLEMRVSVQTVP
jgi:hypothetical protein